MSQCRVCLTVNVRMYLLSNTRYQDIYEKLSGTKLSTEDGMPDTVCFVCNSQLQKFCKFFDMSEEAEKFLKNRVLGSHEISQTTQNKMKLVVNLSKSSIQSISYLDNGEEIEPEVTVTIKEEPVDLDDEILKEEYLDSLPTDEIFPEVDAIMKTTPVLGNLPGILTEPDKPTLSEFPNMELNKEVCIKSESIEANEESLMHNLNIALERIPLKKTGKNCFKNGSKAGNREQSYYCSICNYRTHTTRALKQHTNVHNPSYEYSCEFCFYRFINDKKLADHRNYCTVCSICGKRFTKTSGLRIHVRLHTGIQPYYCDTCGRGFNQKTNLQTHMRVHNREKQYTCKICSKKFPYKSFLKRHMLIHGTNPIDVETLQRIMNCHKLHNRKKNKPCVCTVCGSTLQSSAGLAMHMRIHSGERPFSCEACHRGFIQKANLMTHVERVHSGDKLFTCNVCHKMFPFNCDMKKHLLSHAEPTSARDFEIFQQKHIYLIHKRLHIDQLTPYACDMCRTRILSY